jgi:ABC-2 type transport system ATP-binding protein
LIEPAISAELEKMARNIEQHSIVDRVDIQQQRVRATLKENITDYSELAVALVHAGIAFKHFGEEETNLESAFMALTRGVGAKI